MLAGGWLTAAAQAQPLLVEAAFSHVDYSTDTATFIGIAVSQGDTRVTAGQAQATGLGFGNSTWKFEGNVIISVQPQGQLRSDQAVVEFRDNHVTRATATGKPALFEEQPTGSHPTVHGHADRIVYDAGEDTVHLSGDAWLSGRHNEQISGPLLVYSIRDERLEAISPGASPGVHFTSAPRQQPRSRRRANGRSGDHQRNLPRSSSHSPDAGRGGRRPAAGDSA
jgi:lipopolysaccharide transport protein LptA